VWSHDQGNLSSFVVRLVNQRLGDRLDQGNLKSLRDRVPTPEVMDNYTLFLRKLLPFDRSAWFRFSGAESRRVINKVL